MVAIRHFLPFGAIICLSTCGMFIASPLQPEGDPLPYKVWEIMPVDKEEEMALGVSEFLVPRPFTNFVQQSDEASRGEKRAKAGSERGGGKRGKRGRGGG
ncbi:hypothetical protein B0H13DRAFT_2318820 [Mycena leptocephala]|nr:hypothetical protein B0H13DRAFT_2318820 [Mycena leptocephala]